MNDADILERDAYRCVRCGVLVVAAVRSCHHRVLGDRSDNRASNKLTLCGSGTTGCHGWVHGNPKKARDQGGWIVSRHAQSTEDVPVLYNQPGRQGWYLLSDDGSLEEAA